MVSRACPERCEPSDWSPDGRTLILTVRTVQRSDVWAMPVEAIGEEDVARPIFAERFNERDARISPDGKWIAYVSDESGREEVSGASGRIFSATSRSSFVAGGIHVAHAASTDFRGDFVGTESSSGIQGHRNPRCSPGAREVYARSGAAAAAPQPTKRTQ